MSFVKKKEEVGLIMSDQSAIPCGPKYGLAK